MNTGSGTCRVGRGHFGRYLLAGLASLMACGTVKSATIVTDHVISQVRQPQAGVPVTFGQVFKLDAVARGETLSASLNGKPVPLQVDAKATYPDGSLRHAVLTVQVPNLAGRSKVPLEISRDKRPPSVGLPVSLAQLLATRYDASVSIDIDGQVYTASARPLLDAAASSHDCKPWGRPCTLWLSGPLVGEWIVSGPVRTASGRLNPDLRVSFDVRAYAGKTPHSIGHVRTDFILENTWAYSPQAQLQYTATLRSGSARYTSPALAQYAYTRWHRTLWWNDVEPGVYLQQDTHYIQDSMAVSRYEPLHPEEAFLASVRQSCAPLDHCDQTNAMGNPGAQAAIGPLPRWTAVYIIDPDVRAYRWMLANTDALGTYPVHFRDQATGWPLSIQKHPYVTILGWTYARGVAKGKSQHASDYRRDLLPNCVKHSPLTIKCTDNWYGTGDPYTWSNAHQPAAGYVAYMVTGSYYYMEEMAFYASMSELEAGASYRGFSKGLIDHARSQVRGKAWVLRELVDAAWLLPDAYPLKAEFNADVRNSIADFNDRYTNNPEANPLGMMNSGSLYALNGGMKNAGTPWQHNFLTWSAGHAAELGFAGAGAFRNWLAKFEIGLMTDAMNDPAHGFCWLEASAYTIQVKDAAGHWLPNYAAVYAATFPSLVGLKCNSPEMVAAMGRLEKRPWQPGEMHGYPTSSTGYPANFQTGLAAAVESGLPNAAQAWRIFQSRSVKPKPPTGYEDFPNFALLPRHVPVNAQADP